MVDPRKLHVPGAWDLRGELLAGASIDDPVAAPVEDERRNADGRQDGSHIDVQKHLEDLLNHRRTRGGALHTGGELHRPYGALRRESGDGSADLRDVSG